MYGLNKNTIYVILATLVVIAVLRMSANDWIILCLTLPAVVMAISFHEFAHAYVADKFGDTTPRNQGRLTLNPLAHLDLTGFVLMMFTHIGWGKPVQINPRNFSTNKSVGFCETMVSLAGPLTNFILAIISVIVVYCIEYFARAFSITIFGRVLVTFLTMVTYVNIGLGVFNLIPLPPLDGEKIFRNLLPYKAQEWLTSKYQALYLIFMLLWIFGALGTIASPIIQFVSNLIYSGVARVFALFL